MKTIKTIKTITINACIACACSLFYLSNAWALLPIEHWQEDNGAQIWLVHSPAIPMVDVQIEFDAGARRDPAAQAGLAAAVALMSSKGVTASHIHQDEGPMDENALGEAWADLGASFEASADRDALVFTLRSLTEADLLARAARLAARQLGQPSYPQAIWQRERERWSAALKEADTHPGTVARKAFTTAVYGNHPYGTITTDATLARIDVSDLQNYHARYLQACRARITVVGALTRAQAHTLAASLLSRLPAGNADACQPLPAVADINALPQAVEQRIPFAASQAHILMGQPGFARSDPDFFALVVANHILGGGSFTSRLMNEIREKRGLSYSIGSYFSPGLHAGAFVASMQTRPDQVEQAVQVMREVISRFVQEGPSEDELRAAKAHLVGGFALRIDSNRKLLGNVANIARHQLPLDYLDHWAQRIEALTVADLHAAIGRKLQPDRMAVVVVGAPQP